MHVTDSLPAGLVFVSADPPPTGHGAQLVWDLANLPGNSGPFTITLTARADPRLGTLGTVTNTVVIQSQSAELRNSQQQRIDNYLHWSSALPASDHSPLNLGGTDGPPEVIVEYASEEGMMSIKRLASMTLAVIVLLGIAPIAVLRVGGYW